MRRAKDQPVNHSRERSPHQRVLNWPFFGDLCIGSCLRVCAATHTTFSDGVRLLVAPAAGHMVASKEILESWEESLECESY